jgi:uncharacterized protein YkwD
VHDYAVQVNQLRLQHNLPPLKLNAQLCDAAQAYAETLAQTGVIAHADAHGRRADYRASEAGYFYHRLGENLAAGQPTWERALHAWLNSSDHRANLLTPDYRELGVGFAGRRDALPNGMGATARRTPHGVPRHHQLGRLRDRHT